jgi:hypothetical protein
MPHYATPATDTHRSDNIAMPPYDAAIFRGALATLRSRIDDRSSIISTASARILPREQRIIYLFDPRAV